MEIDPLLLKSLLVARGLTLRELALAIGTPPSTLGAWLHHVGRTPEDLTTRIAGILNVAPETFCKPLSQ